MFGQETTEFWAAAGDADAPLVFARKYDIGCLAQASVQCISTTICSGWATSGGSTARPGRRRQRISTPTVEEQLRLAGDDADDNATVFPGAPRRPQLLRAEHPRARDLLFNAQGRGWIEWSSHGRGLFRVSCGVMSGGEPYLGDDETGTIWKFGTAQQLDGSTRIPHKVSAFLDNPGRPQRAPPITLKAVMGQGAHTSPEAELRVSRDRGRTFEPWQARSLGQQGEYDLKATWRRLGMVDTRGLLIEIRHSENIVSAALGLETGGAAMTGKIALPPDSVPLTGKDGRITREWLACLQALQRRANAESALGASVATAADQAAAQAALGVAPGVDVMAFGGSLETLEGLEPDARRVHRRRRGGLGDQGRSRGAGGAGARHRDRCPGLRRRPRGAGRERRQRLLGADRVGKPGRPGRSRPGPGSRSPTATAHPATRRSRSATRSCWLWRA